MPALRKGGTFGIFHTMEKISISAPDGTAKAWKAAAAAYGSAIGEPVGVSELVRRAVQAFDPMAALTTTFKADAAVTAYERGADEVAVLMRIDGFLGASAKDDPWYFTEGPGKDYRPALRRAIDRARLGSGSNLRTGRGDAPKARKVAHSRTPDTARKMEGPRPTGSGEDASAGERMGFVAEGRGGSGGGAILEGKDRFAAGSAVSDGVRDAEGVEGSPAARPLDRGRVPSSRTASAVGAENAAPASPARRPFPKQDQIKKPKR